MTKNTNNSFGRSISITFAIFVFFFFWAIIAARPWTEEPKLKTDPRILALDARETRLRHDAAQVNMIIKRRWNTYQAQLKMRKRQIAHVRTAQAKVNTQAMLRRVTISASVQSSPSSSATSSPSSAPIVRVAPRAPAVTQTKTS